MYGFLPVEFKHPATELEVDGTDPELSATGEALTVIPCKLFIQSEERILLRV